MNENLDFVWICLRRLFDRDCSYCLCCVIAILPCCFDALHNVFFKFATMIYMVNKVEHVHVMLLLKNEKLLSNPQSMQLLW